MGLLSVAIGNLREVQVHGAHLDATWVTRITLFIWEIELTFLNPLVLLVLRISHRESRLPSEHFVGQQSV